MWLFKKQVYASDEDLLKHYKQSGDKELFSQLFKNHVKSIYGTCLFYFHDKDEAQDATMQLFEKLLNTIHTQNIVNFKGWLSFVVRNHCISIIRKNKSHQKNIQSYYEFEYAEANLEEEEKTHSVTDETMLMNLELCLLKLKNPQQICLTLFYLQNKSYQAIADETSYSLNEIKSYIQNGKRNLKLLLSELQQHNGK